MSEILYFNDILPRSTHTSIQFTLSRTFSYARKTCEEINMKKRIDDDGNNEIVKRKVCSDNSSC